MRSEPFRLEDHIEFVEVDGLRVRYCDVGVGLPIVLIHGLGLALEAWLYNIAAISASYRVLALDLPGSGMSDVPRSGAIASWDDLAAFVRHFLNSLGVDEQVMVAAQSMGGLVAVRFALAHPDRVSKLVLIDSAGLGREVHIAARLAAIPPIGELFIRPSRLLYKVVARLVTVRRDFASDAFLDELVLYGRRSGARSVLLSNLRRIADMRGQRTVFGAEELQRLTMPSLVMWGELDGAFPLKHAQHALKHVPDSRAVTFKDTGHASPLERPDTFNRIMLEFLDSGRLADENQAREMLWV